jgi:hypothetical protein
MSQESILVVDDEEVMRDVLGQVLRQAGYDVAFAETGPRGVEMARKGSYAAAIVDVMLPEMGGLDVLEELKKIDPDIVVLMRAPRCSRCSSSSPRSPLRARRSSWWERAGPARSSWPRRSTRTRLAATSPSWSSTRAASPTSCSSRTCSDT